MVSKKQIAGIAIVAALFIFATYFAGVYQTELQALVGEQGVVSMLFYVLLSAGLTVVAPLSPLPLLPVAVAVWGSLVAGILSIVGWTIGSVIAYEAARRFGRPLVERLVDMSQVEKYVNAGVGDNKFLSVVILHVIVPVDIISYALGLFISMRTSVYALATLIGITPFAFVFAYTAALPVLYQVVVGVLTATVIGTVYYRIHRKNRTK